MSITATPFDANVDYAITADTGPGITTENDLRNAPSTLYSLGLDNSANGAQAESVKLYDSTGEGLTAGVTAPFLIVGLKAAEVTFLVCPEGLPFLTGLTIGAAQEDGTAMTTNPTSGVPVQLLTTI